MTQNETISITFGEQVENHRVMEKIGQLAENGYDVQDFDEIIKKLQEDEIEYKLVDLKKNLPSNIKNDDNSSYDDLTAKVLIIKKGVNYILSNPKGADYLFNEQKTLPFDRKAYMRGRVVNKRARWNSCFADFSQKPDYENKKGTIVSFKKTHFLKRLRNRLHKFFGKKAKKLYAEMNYYYDVEQCGIGFHGDTERKIVICARLGETMNIHFQWFFNRKPIGKREILNLNHGDMYIMSEKAVGLDWKRSIIPTLRHAAGCSKYTSIK